MTRAAILPRRLAAIGSDSRGATLVEFAFVAPVLGLVLLGAFDVAHTLYMRGVLQGVVQKVARDSSLESGTEAEQQAKLDGRVSKQVKQLAKDAEITFTRRFYRTFSEAAAARAEIWTDLDDDGICNNSEPYEDANHNNTWDRDGGNAGQGGAKDATVYTVTVTHQRFFPIYNIIGGSNTTTIRASTVLRNQPYSDQGTYDPPVVRNCPPPPPVPTP